MFRTQPPCSGSPASSPSPPSPTPSSSGAAVAVEVEAVPVVPSFCFASGARVLSKTGIFPPSGTPVSTSTLPVVNTRGKRGRARWGGRTACVDAERGVIMCCLPYDKSFSHQPRVPFDTGHRGGRGEKGWRGWQRQQQQPSRWKACRQKNGNPGRKAGFLPPSLPSPLHPTAPPLPSLSVLPSAPPPPFFSPM